jgi:glutathione S-transferase
MIDTQNNGLELYHSDYSTCSQKVRLVMAEKNLTFQSHLINFRKKEHLSESYLKLNPNGVVPTLIHHDRPVVDSSVIVEYLDEVFLEPKLSPEDPIDRAEMRAWMRFIEEVPTVAIRFPSFQKVFVQHFKHFSKEDFEKEAVVRPLRTEFYRKMGQDGFSDEDYQASLDDLRRTCERIEKAVSERSWIVGENYTLADVVVTPTFDRMNDLGMSDLWQDLPSVQKWWQRIQARPNFDTAFYPGSRISERDDQPKIAS